MAIAFDFSWDNVEGRSPDPGERGHEGRIRDPSPGSQPTADGDRVERADLLCRPKSPHTWAMPMAERYAVSQPRATKKQIHINKLATRDRKRRKPTPATRLRTGPDRTSVHAAGSELVIR